MSECTGIFETSTMRTTRSMKSSFLPLCKYGTLSSGKYPSKSSRPVPPPRRCSRLSASCQGLSEKVSSALIPGVKSLEDPDSNSSSIKNMWELSTSCQQLLSVSGNTFKCQHQAVDFSGRLSMSCQQLSTIGEIKDTDALQSANLDDDKKINVNLEFKHTRSTSIKAPKNSISTKHPKIATLNADLKNAKIAGIKSPKNFRESKSFNRRLCA